MFLPAYFKCPRDSTIETSQTDKQRRGTEEPGSHSTWEFWGTSYAINWYWSSYYRVAPLGSASPYEGDRLTILGAKRMNDVIVPGLGRHMMKSRSGRWASEFILFFENRLNYALKDARPPDASGDEASPELLRGWHRQVGLHSAAFRDGSARYQKLDTRFVTGIGWTTWPSKQW